MMIDSERQAEKDAIVKIEAYMKYQKHVYRRIEKERAERADPSEQLHDHLEKELEVRIRELQAELLEIEMKLQDALLASRKTFISRVSQIIEDMKQLNQEYIGNVAVEVVAFNEKFRADALTEHERFHAFVESLNDEDQAKEMENNKEYMEVMIADWGEQDTLVTTLETFKE